MGRGESPFFQIIKMGKPYLNFIKKIQNLFYLIAEEMKLLVLLRVD